MEVIRRRSYNGYGVPPTFDADLDAACFMMLVEDLPTFIGNVGRPANRKTFVRDAIRFNDWIYVLSDPVVIKVDGGDTDDTRQALKASIISNLRQNSRLTLTSNSDFKVLSKNQVNIPIMAMVKALVHSHVRSCRVQMYGMKWSIQEAQPIIDSLIQRYIIHEGNNALNERNRFDIGVLHPTDNIQLFKFNDIQIANQQHVFPMFDTEYGSIAFKPNINAKFELIKIYHDLVHEVVSVIPKDNLDDMPVTTRTMRTRHEQLHNLFTIWNTMDAQTRRSRLWGIRVEVTVININLVHMAYDLCVQYDILRRPGVEQMLGGTFDTHHMLIPNIITTFQAKLQQLGRVIEGANQTTPPITVRTALTEVRQAIGWSGKNMAQHLDELRRWRVALQHAQADDNNQPGQYPGWQQDTPPQRQQILYFIETVKWFHHGRRNQQTPGPPIMLQRRNGGGFFPRIGIYSDQPEAARYFMIQFPNNTWRDHIVLR